MHMSWHTPDTETHDDASYATPTVLQCAAWERETWQTHDTETHDDASYATLTVLESGAALRGRERHTWERETWERDTNDDALACHTTVIFPADSQVVTHTNPSPHACTFRKALEIRTRAFSNLIFWSRPNNIWVTSRDTPKMENKKKSYSSHRVLEWQPTSTSCFAYKNIFYFLFCVCLLRDSLLDLIDPSRLCDYTRN